MALPVEWEQHSRIAVVAERTAAVVENNAAVVAVAVQGRLAEA